MSKPFSIALVHIIVVLLYRLTRPEWMFVFMKQKRLLDKVAHRYRNRVRECRLKAMIAKQEQLATMSGISRTIISALENDRLFLSSAYALILAEVLGCTLDDLYERRPVDGVSAS